MKAIATVGERLQLIKDWQLSGLTISEWCRRNGIHKNTFSNWIHRSRKQGLLETPAVMPGTRSRMQKLTYRMAAAASPITPAKTAFAL